MEYLEVSHATVKNWLEYLKELYFLFEVKPWQKRIPRSQKKESKVYLWEYSEIDDKAARFENPAACHLLKACDYWSDSGEGDFKLYYLIIGCKCALQLVNKQYWNIHKFNDFNILVADAAEVFQYFV